MLAGDLLNPVRVAVVILAAGGSTRLGQPKQLLRYEGELLVSRTARIAGNIGCAPIVVVTGGSALEVEAALTSPLFAHAVFNPDWETGMGSSIGVGVSALIASDVPFDALLLLVCDQLLVTDTLLLEIRQTYRATGKRVVASEYGETWGVPCLFDRTILPELAALRGSGGAKSIIERYRKRGDAITVSFPGGMFDVDTPADWERWQEIGNNKPSEAT